MAQTLAFVGASPVVEAKWPLEMKINGQSFADMADQEMPCIYTSRADAANFERLCIRREGGSLRIWQEAMGAGCLRALHLHYGNGPNGATETPLPEGVRRHYNAYGDGSWESAYEPSNG